MTTKTIRVTKNKKSREKKGVARTASTDKSTKKDMKKIGEGQRPCLSAQERQQRITLTAFRRAQKRNFENGSALEDWLAAEAEIDAESSRATTLE